MEQLIGQPISRIDGRLKVTGRAPYAYEQRVPDAAYAVLITSTIARGTISAIDSQAAEKSPGVMLVMTPENSIKLPQLKNQPPGGWKVQVLQDKVVRYANQPVGVVVADTLENAIEGTRLVEIRYRAEPPRVDLDGRLNETYSPQKAGRNPAVRQRGDIQAALSQANAHIDQVYRTPFEFHNAMEPHATIAVWDALDHLTIYDATQGVFGDQARVASLFGLKPENVRVISPYLGGGFGSKGPMWSHVILTAMAARQLNRPVKLAISRPQMFGMVGFRSQTRQTIRAGAQSDGTLNRPAA